MVPGVALYPDHFRTQEMFERALEKVPWLLIHISDQYRTQEMCNKAFKKYPLLLGYHPDQYRTRKYVIRQLRRPQACSGKFLIRIRP